MTNETWDTYKGEIKGVRIEQSLNDPTSVAPPYHPPAEKEFIAAMQSIARTYGKLADKDENGIWVGYLSQSENDNYKIGVKCANCANFESDNVCKVVKAKIEPGGYCRFAAIPSGIVQNEKTKRKNI